MVVPALAACDAVVDPPISDESADYFSDHMPVQLDRWYLVNRADQFDDLGIAMVRFAKTDDPNLFATVYRTDGTGRDLHGYAGMKIDAYDEWLGARAPLRQTITLYAKDRSLIGVFEFQIALNKGSSYQVRNVTRGTAPILVVRSAVGGGANSKDDFLHDEPVSLTPGGPGNLEMLSLDRRWWGLAETNDDDYLEGRYRAFHQTGCDVKFVEDPDADVFDENEELSGDCAFELRYDDAGAPQFSFRFLTQGAADRKFPVEYAFQDQVRIEDEFWRVLHVKIGGTTLTWKVEEETAPSDFSLFPHPF